MGANSFFEVLHNILNENNDTTEVKINNAINYYFKYIIKEINSEIEILDDGEVLFFNYYKLFFPNIKDYSILKKHRDLFETRISEKLREFRKNLYAEKNIIIPENDNWDILETSQFKKLPIIEIELKDFNNIDIPIFMDNFDIEIAQRKRDFLWEIQYGYKDDLKSERSSIKKLFFSTEPLEEQRYINQLFNLDGKNINLTQAMEEQKIYFIHLKTKSKLRTIDGIIEFKNNQISLTNIGKDPFYIKRKNSLAPHIITKQTTIKFNEGDELLYEYPNKDFLLKLQVISLPLETEESKTEKDVLVNPKTTTIIDSKNILKPSTKQEKIVIEEAQNYLWQFNYTSKKETGTKHFSKKKIFFGRLDLEKEKELEPSKRKFIKINNKMICLYDEITNNPKCKFDFLSLPYSGYGSLSRVQGLIYFEKDNKIKITNIGKNIIRIKRKDGSRLRLHQGNSTHFNSIEDSLLYHPNSKKKNNRSYTLTIDMLGKDFQKQNHKLENNKIWEFYYTEKNQETKIFSSDKKRVFLGRLDIDKQANLHQSDRNLVKINSKKVYVYDEVKIKNNADFIQLKHTQNRLISRIQSIITMNDDESIIIQNTGKNSIRIKQSNGEMVKLPKNKTHNFNINDELLYYPQDDSYTLKIKLIDKVN